MVLATVGVQDKVPLGPPLFKTSWLEEEDKLILLKAGEEPEDKSWSMVDESVTSKLVPPDVRVKVDPEGVDSMTRSLMASLTDKEPLT